MVKVARGPFALKNIAEPVEIVELLWREGMAPQTTKPARR